MTSPGEPADFPGIRRAFDSSVDDPLAPDDHEDIEAPEPPRPKPSAQHSSSQEAERLLERSRERLNNTLRLAEESEMVGSDVLTRLAADRDIIDRNLSRTAGSVARTSCTAARARPVGCDLLCVFIGVHQYCLRVLCITAAQRQN
eukprot:TRINITY_DN2407_c0_g1_i1.p1 TRINITY_DN2407_c0_g1~~TRINITY_DN2407_c0_g1_i1.p1  ORF type:complete len:145 (+),score=5.03 TRINITY_DN2407_c0_g1_i1:438-872(+)